MINAAEQPQFPNTIAIAINPYSSSAGAPRTCSPLRTALGEVIFHIERRCPLVIVTGRTGTGKTLLMDMIACACSDMGLAARQVTRDDLTNSAPRAPVDVLLADNADSIAVASLARLIPAEGNSVATTCVLMCPPSSASRFNRPGANVVHVQNLSILDARTYLLEQANSIGRPDLFSPDAMELIVRRAAGSCRSLRSIASLAFSTAAWEGETQISVRHVIEVLELANACDSDRGWSSRAVKSFHDDSVGQSGTKHLPERKSDFSEGTIGGREIQEHPLKHHAVRRTGRLAAIAVGVAAFIGLASAASGLLMNANDFRDEVNLARPWVRPRSANRQIRRLTLPKRLLLHPRAPPTKSVPRATRPNLRQRRSRDMLLGLTTRQIQALRPTRPNQRQPPIRHLSRLVKRPLSRATSIPGPQLARVRR